MFSTTTWWMWMKRSFFLLILSGNIELILILILDVLFQTKLVKNVLLYLPIQQWSSSAALCAVGEMYCSSLSVLSPVQLGFVSEHCQGLPSHSAPGSRPSDAHQSQLSPLWKCVHLNGEKLQLQSKIILAKCQCNSQFQFGALSNSVCKRMVIEL